MPETSCFPIPKSMSYDQAAISEPLAIGVYAVRLAKMDFAGKNVGILGFGPIGMSVLLPLLHKGAKNIYVTDKIDVHLMPSHRYKFEDTKQAFDLAAGYSDSVMKAMIDLD